MRIAQVEQASEKCAKAGKSFFRMLNTLLPSEILILGKPVKPMLTTYESLMDDQGFCIKKEISGNPLCDTTSFSPVSVELFLGNLALAAVSNLNLSICFRCANRSRSFMRRKYASTDEDMKWMSGNTLKSSFKIRNL
jgi:hypothetical protein